MDAAVEDKIRSLLQGNITDKKMMRNLLFTLLKPRPLNVLRGLAEAFGAVNVLENQLLRYDRSAMREGLLDHLLSFIIT